MIQYSCRRFFRRYTFKIKDSTVEVSYKGLFDSEEYEIPFESVGDRKVVGVYASNSAFVVAFFALFVLVFMVLIDSVQGFLFVAFIGIVALLYGILSRQGKISMALLSGVGGLELYFNKQTRDQAVQFADTLIACVRAFVKQKYSNFDRQMPLEKQFDNLEYLRERELLTSEEYNEIKNYLLGNGKRNIGFYN